jgi:hypothetical protein
MFFSRPLPVAHLLELYRAGAVEAAILDERHALMQLTGVEEGAVPVADVKLTVASRA